MTETQDKGYLSIVVGGQFGSEGKGAVAGWLARPEGEQGGSPLVTAAVRVAGPNAGHSAMDANGKVWPLRCIPVMAVTNLECMLVIAAGSEVDPEVLATEVNLLESSGIPVAKRLIVDWQATWLEPHHIDAEGGYGGHLTQKVGSTGKGIGAARAERIWRRAKVWGDRQLFGQFDPIYGTCLDTGEWLRQHLALSPANHAVIEGTQGFGLGLHTGFYPQCTSSDARAVDFAAMAGVTPWTDARQTDVWVTLRTFPIRVAGNSGPMHEETDWETLTAETDGYIKPERTTVTQVQRRVGRWDGLLAKRAVEANGGSACKVALTFFDYWYPELAGATSDVALTSEHVARIDEIEAEIGATVRYLGTGPGDGIFLDI